MNIKYDMKLHNKKILDFLKKKKVITSSELAEFLKISWNTADKYLLELAFEGKIQRIKKSGVNLWLLK
jgi:Mn-dependent DtxR family transcriptional regulator